MESNSKKANAARPKKRFIGSTSTRPSKSGSTIIAHNIPADILVNHLNSYRNGPLHKSLTLPEELRVCCHIAQYDLACKRPPSRIIYNDSGGVPAHEIRMSHQSKQLEIAMRDQLTTTLSPSHPQSTLCHCAARAQVG